MKTKPKHNEISGFLETEIAAGRYKDGDRLPSEVQLVQKFSVSRPTVARALRDLESKGLIDRRAGSGTYVRSNHQRTVATRILGLLVPGLATTEIFQIICGEIASLARVNDYGLLWGGSTNPRVDTDASLKHAEEICKQFIERKVNGVFFAPAELQPGQEEANTRLAESLREAGIPAVLLDRDLLNFPERSDFDLVGIDNMAGGYLVAQHLLKLGCQRIFFVARPLSAATVNARIAGVREAFVRHHIEPDPNWVRNGDPTDLKFVRSLIAARQARHIMPNWFVEAQLALFPQQQHGRRRELLRDRADGVAHVRSRRHVGIDMRLAIRMRVSQLAALDHCDRGRRNASLLHYLFGDAIDATTLHTVDGIHRLRRTT